MVKSADRVPEATIFVKYRKLTKFARGQLESLFEGFCRISKHSMRISSEIAEFLYGVFHRRPQGLIFVCKRYSNASKPSSCLSFSKISRYLGYNIRTENQKPNSVRNGKASTMPWANKYRYLMGCQDVLPGPLSWSQTYAFISQAPGSMFWPSGFLKSG
jgi:hypothetical protein